jgi:hypothetical protein
MQITNYKVTTMKIKIHSIFSFIRRCVIPYVQEKFQDPYSDALLWSGNKVEKFNLISKVSGAVIFKLSFIRRTSRSVFLK